MSSLIRLFVAGSLELGNDEVYYQTYARHLQWNYFDHPPMVALLIRLTTCNLFFSHEIFIRLGPVLCAAAGTWLIYKIGVRVRNEQAGFIAAVLYSTSFYTSVIAGIFILPDSPLVIFWLLSVYAMVCILTSTGGGRNKYFIILGVSAGLCLMSKVHGIFLWFGFGAYLILYRKDLIRLPMLWISIFITMIIACPIFFWNLNNHFVTYRYHQGRISLFGGRPDADHLLQQVLGSVFYNNPVNIIMYILALSVFFRSGMFRKHKMYSLLLWLSFPLILVLLITSVYNETLPHWSGPAYISMMILAACWLCDQLPVVRTRWLRTACWCFVVIVFSGTMIIRYMPWRIGSRLASELGKGDVTLDMIGWKKFALDFDSLYRSDINTGRMSPGTIIISDYWFPAGHLDHYYAIPCHHNLLVFGGLNNIHHFAWLNQIRPRMNKGTDAYFIYPTNNFGPPKPELKKKFENVGDSLLIPQFRAGNTVRYFVIYRMHHFRGDSTDYLISGIR